MKRESKKNSAIQAATKTAGQTKDWILNRIDEETFYEPAWWQIIIPPTLLAFLTALVYYPSLRYPFQFDDLANISKKFAIRFDNPWTRWLTTSRWLGDWLNRVNYEMGRFEPFTYRLTNLIIHLLTGVFLFFLIYQLCRFLKQKPFFYNHALILATTTAGLFLLHPVQTQTISYVIQARIEGLASLLVIATICFFVHFFNARHAITRWASFFLFFLLGLFSWGTKEIVVVLPFLLLLIDWFFIAQEEWAVFKEHLWIHLTFGLFFFGAMLHYLGKGFVGDALSLKAITGNNRGNILTEHALHKITPYHFFISQFKVILHYLTMFVWPFGISVEYDWKLQTSFFSFEVIVPFLILCSIFFYTLSRAIIKQSSYLSFGLFWFLICIAPRSSFIPSPELVFDYKTYLASVGILFIAAVCIVSLFIKLGTYLEKSQIANGLFNYPFLKRHSLYYVLLFMIISPLSFCTQLRNKIWSSSLAFWEDTVKKAPLKARAHNNYGVALSEAKRVDESIEEYKKAIALDRFYQDPLSNLAVAYSMKGETDKAINALQAAIRISPHYPEAYNNIGSLYLQKGMFDEAEKNLRKALKIRPYYGKAHFNLARFYELKKEPEKVWQCLKNATEGDLDIPEIFFRFGVMSMRVQKYQEATKAFETTIARGITDDRTWFYLGNAYFMLGQIDKAETIYQRLVQNAPTNMTFAYNLAETYFQKKQYSQALSLFHKITKSNKSLPQSFIRVASCLEQMKKFHEAKQYLEKLLTVKAPENFLKTVQNELTRIQLKEKVIHGNGSIRLSDLQQTLAQRQTTANPTQG